MTDLNAFIASLEARAAERGLMGAGGMFNDSLHVSVDPVQKRGSNRKDHFRVSFKLNGKRVSEEAARASLSH